jgi:hypothetical protein
VGYPQTDASTSRAYRSKNFEISENGRPISENGRPIREVGLAAEGLWCWPVLKASKIFRNALLLEWLALSMLQLSIIFVVSCLLLSLNHSTFFSKSG